MNSGLPFLSLFKRHLNFRLEKTHSACDALNLLTLPFNPLAHAQFHCNRCNCNLSNSFELLEHELLKFKCSQCQLRFCTGKLRRQHRSKTHQRLLSCTDCGLSFSTRVQLRDHLQLKPLSCACCSIGFHSKIALRLHLVKQMKLMENNSGCGFEEAPTIDVKNHQCKVCESQFSSSNLLALHMDLHSSSKFKCGDCGARYLHKLHLARHIKLKHLLRSLFRCNICQETFNTRVEVNFLIFLTESELDFYHRFFCRFCRIAIVTNLRKWLNWGNSLLAAQFLRLSLHSSVLFVVAARLARVS